MIQYISILVEERHTRGFLKSDGYNPYP
jgi:hypothetical protein